MRKKVLAVAALALASLGGAALAQQIGMLQGGYIQEGNLMRPGNLIDTITMSNRGQNADTCRKACDDNDRCNAYSYVQTAPSRKPVCHMRMIALPSNSRRDHGYAQVVSGTKISFIADAHNITLYGNTGLTGAIPLRAVPSRANDPVECSRLCSGDAACQAFTYTPPSRTAGRVTEAMCTLNKTAGRRMAQTGLLTGIKGGGVPARAPVGQSVPPAVRETRGTMTAPALPAQRAPSLGTIQPPATPPAGTDPAPQPGESEFPGEMTFPGEMNAQQG